uniref:Uncharacterized protein n=1 Tax=Arundo donax TaxID=35708 RepID=A0A0A8Z6B2_ARUDO
MAVRRVLNTESRVSLPHIISILASFSSKSSSSIRGISLC